ncbi:MAG: AI-2E family transporter [Prevotellaceae bacterium]|jgi:predicted PurR-regulated permease PerM|nr:AI-2E family transporter [Prevotellaceae bacterium]
MENSKQQLNRILKQVLFLLSLIALGGFIFYKLNFFMSGFLGALTLYVLFRKPMLYLTEKKHWNVTLASSAILLAVLAVISTIGYWVANLIYAKVSGIHPAVFSAIIDPVALKVEELTGYKLFSVDTLEKVNSQILSMTTSLLNTTYNVAANVVMSFFVLFFMLENARLMEQKISDYLPFRSETVSEVKAEVHQMILSNAVGIPLVMLAQGGLAMLIYLIFGVQNVIFWGFLTGLFGLLPLVGTALVWAPLGVYSIITGDTMNGIGILVFGMMVITNVDNLLRFILMKKMADTHPLVTILGVIMGIPLFGFMGIIFGPLLISIFMLFLKIYRMEYFSKK